MADEEIPPMVAIHREQLGQLRAISNLLGTQNAGAIEKFSGDPKKFTGWIKGLEKYIMVIGADKETSMKSAVLQSSDGPVSEFLLRYYQNSPESTWTEVFAQLKSRFCDIIDTQHALQVLRTTKQKPGETAQVYAERLIGVAEQAWPDADLNEALISRQLTDAFVDGLTDNAVARRVLRDNPATFNEAVQVAVYEQNLNRKIQLRNRAEPKFRSFRPPKYEKGERSEEPMEVDSFRGRCYKCDKPGHRAIECKTKPKPKSVFETTKVRLTCFKCGQEGHRLSTCRNPGNPQTGRCWCCGSRDHRHQQCSKQAGQNKANSTTENKSLNEQTLA